LKAYKQNLITQAFTEVVRLVKCKKLFQGKKRKRGSSFCLASLAYGRFLDISTAKTATHTIMTIITAAIPSSTVPVDARPVGGAAVGAGVGGGLPA
jgi:hypothetical protein